jgi:hypothetical protein
MKLRDLLDVLDEVVDNSDTSGCSEDLTVTSSFAIERLGNLLPDFREFVDQWERIEPAESETIDRNEFEHPEGENLNEKSL